MHPGSTSIKKSKNALSRNDWKPQVRRVLPRVIDGLVCRAHFGVETEVVSGVKIAIKAGEIGRRHLEPDPVSLAEEIGGDADFEGVLVHGSRFQESRIEETPRGNGL